MSAISIWHCKCANAVGNKAATQYNAYKRWLSMYVVVIYYTYSYLVDPASSHMLVSKIKPCMCKYKRYTKWNCEWLIKSVIVYLIVQISIWISVVILELIHEKMSDLRKEEGQYLLEQKPTSSRRVIVTVRIAQGFRAGDVSFKYLPYQLSMVW